MQVGCPLNYDTLKDTIINIRKSAKSDKKVPLSIVVISDRDWLIGGTNKRTMIFLGSLLLDHYYNWCFICDSVVSADATQADKQLAYTLLLAENICEKHGIMVSSSLIIS